MRPRHVLLGAAAALLLLAGCGSGPVPAASPSVAALSGRLQQYREDEVAHVLQVELRNDGPTTVRVDGLRVAWPGLDGTADARPAYDLRPGVTTALSVPYGAAVCTSPTRPTDAVTAVVTSGGSTYVVPLTASAELLTNLWDVDCARQRLLEQVGVVFGDRWIATTEAGAPVLRGTLELTRGTATGPVQVVDLDGSVLLTLDGTPPRRTPLLTMAPGDRTASLSIDVGATMRCTGHVLGESKKTYVFDVGLDLGAGRVDLTLQPPDDVKPQMYAVIERACHL